MIVTGQYSELVSDVSRLAERITARYSKHIVCRAGCSGCCSHHLSVFEVEAAVVRQAVQSLPAGTREILVQLAEAAMASTTRGKSAVCPLLVDRRCAVYAARPIICRTQGLPLLILADDGTQELDFCPLNFSAPCATDDLDEDHLVALEEINQRLVRVNLHHCAEVGLDLHASGTRKLMGAIILEQR